MLPYTENIIQKPSEYTYFKFSQKTQERIYEDEQNRILIDEESLPSTAFFTFFNSQNVVNSVNFSDDGHLISVGCSDSSIRLYDFKKTQVVNGMNPQAKLLHKTFSPSTSFDWNTINIDRVCSCSIDTTCSVWSVETGQLVKKLIAHDKEVFDVSFAANPDIFGTVGGDGSLRMFDLRSLEHSTILYESQGLVPLLRLQWNKFDPNFIATFAMDSDKVIIIDVRQPAIPYTQLKVHRNSVNAISWAPNKATQLCSASDDHKALIWDIAPVAEGADPQVLQYEAEAEVNNIVWATFVY
ncbi:transcription initiation factor tfIId subunittaf73 putative [Entamoeba histolytica]|uniref:Transcription initiation factor tfIId subunittaf73 putative n=1 Tax=Entamoeba histolytica TaxID=5759 RepID=A0A175JV21_ENTHI|nr:transcription initiation factor tfIId subunittaf73 putative [Entamoeba histolytica]